MALELAYRSIPEMFLRRVSATPDRRALGFPGPDGEPAWLTWSEVGTRATAIAAGLIGLGVAPQDRVAILASTRLEWLLADFGVMCAGAATTTVYPTTAARDAQFIVTDSGSRVVIAENAEQADKLTGLDVVEHVVLIDGPGELTLADLERRGAAALDADPELISRVVDAIAPDQLATLIYTSGTTGRPKGVRLLHRGWVWEGAAQTADDLIRPDDVHYLWLPLSHSFGKTLICGLTHAGTPTYVDGRVDQIVANLGTIRPTLMCAAPRVFEKVYNAAVTTANSGGAAKARVFSWAVGVGRQVVELRQAGRPVPGWLAVRHRLADRLVFSKLRARLGGRMRILVSGSAPLSVDIAGFFAAAGLPILEGYGLTETSAATFVNRPGKVRIGTVGTRLGDLEYRIADDGEVLLRGAPVMAGYHNLPEETATVFTEDGYLRTGDIGEVDSDGYLRITDRKKDLIKTSGGKYVAPTHIEGLFKAICPYVSHAIVVGQSRNYCVLLVTLDPEAIAGWTAGGPLEGESYERVASSDEAQALIAGSVEELNTRLNRWETIKRFTVLPRDLSIENGELTPSLKVKRREVEAAFSDEIERLYDGTVAHV